MATDPTSDLQWKIVTTGTDVQLAGTARVLNALSGMADAVALASRDLSLPADVRTSVSQASVPAALWAGPVSEAHYTAVGALLTVVRQSGTVLVSLHTGSIEGRIRDILRRIRAIGRLMDASTTLLPHTRDPEQFWNDGLAVLRDLAEGPPSSEASNVLAVSGRELMLAYGQVGASAAGVPAPV